MIKVRFAHPLVIASRTVENTQQDPGYEASSEGLAFPWVAVWPKGNKAAARLTTMFNIVDRDPGDDALAEPPIAKQVKR